jgi:hypothetical protein
VIFGLLKWFPEGAGRSIAPVINDYSDTVKKHVANQENCCRNKTFKKPSRRFKSSYSFAGRIIWKKKQLEAMLKQKRKNMK